MQSELPFLPRSLTVHQEINLVSPHPYLSRMPIHLLQNSDSRMPIKVFEDSVHYTILKKKF